MIGRLHAIGPAQAWDDRDFVPYGELGHKINGLPNLTQNVKPPKRPEPEDEIGVGRAPNMVWESREHPIYDNPDFDLDQPMTFFEPHDGEGLTHGPPGLDRMGAIMALDFYQQHEEQSWFGWQQDVTVQPRAATPNTQTSRLEP